MNLNIFGYSIYINLISILEILIIYLMIFLFIKFVLLARIGIQVKLLICLFIGLVIVLEIVSRTLSYSNIFIVKYRSIIYIGFIVIFLSVFQPELRYVILKTFNLYKKSKIPYNNISNVMELLKPLQEKKMGALIVLENSISVEPYITSHIEVDSKLTSEILLSIFSKLSILHDGAVVISGDRVKYAKVFFKFVDSQISDSRLGARHRAAIFISTQTDADVFVISEERNTISHCKNGTLNEIHY